MIQVGLAKNAEGYLKKNLLSYLAQSCQIFG
jgi:hypothetical protein